MGRPINVEVRLRDGESTERLIRRFIKKAKKEGIVDQYKERMYYEKPSDTKRHAKRKSKRIAREAQKQINDSLATGRR